MNARSDASAAIGDPKPEKLLTAKDIAQMLQVSEKWVYNAVEQKLIPSYRMGRLIRFRHAEVTAWLEGAAVPAGAR